MARLGILSTLLLLLISCASGKKAEPEVVETSFDGKPTNLFYFDDSEVVLLKNEDAGVVYRSTGVGDSWEPVRGIPEGKAALVLKHPFQNTVAVALGYERTHWITDDRGETWRSFETEARPDFNLYKPPPISFHAGDKDKFLFRGLIGDVFESQKTWYTTDSFKTLGLLRHNTDLCLWVRVVDIFTSGDSDLDDRGVICVVQGKFSPWEKDFRIVISKDYFRDDEIEPSMASGRPVSGILSIAAVKGYFVAAARSEGTKELALYVSNDVKTWHRAEFSGHKVEQGAYTVLESTNYSVQVDVMTTHPNSPMGVLFTSNSEGTFFTRNIQHTNRNKDGYVDFEKVQNIQGIVIVNTVDNWEEVADSWLPEKKLRTSISFDDGRTFQSLKVGGENLHLHHVTEERSRRRVFTSPAPGLVMGVGNTGKYLDTYENGNLYVSDDAGLTWVEALKGSHMYQFGDQGAILVAVSDSSETDKIFYSIDHGRNWESFKLDDQISAQLLTTVPDSTSLKFILIARKGNVSGSKHFIYSLNFEGLHERKCEDKDFEKWYARLGEDGEPKCVMGHKQAYRRRKADADCFIDEEFKHPDPKFEACECSDEDFECDFNFTPSEDGKSCEPVTPLEAPEGTCDDPDGTFLGSSGYRQIPGNACFLSGGGVKKDQPVERPCRDTKKPSSNEAISSEASSFEGGAFKEYYYLERKASSTGDDETVVMLTDRGAAYITHDHGKVWRQAVNSEVVAIYPHQYFSDNVYFITPSKKVYYSKDRGKVIHSFDAPEKPTQERIKILKFHPKEEDWLIWTGSKDCSQFGADCHAVAHVSTKGGEEWNTLLPFVRKCEFMWREKRKDSEQLVFCEQFRDENPSKELQLMSSEDWFEHKKVQFDDIVSFAQMSEFIVVATRNETDKQYLTCDTSIDGKTFAPALFPPNFKVPKQQAYTVLESSTHSIFLHVTVNAIKNQEYGSIIKSNSNGTSYVLSVGGVNRNTLGYVDFEKMQGLEGVAIINVVANTKDVEQGKPKKFQTMITHNDGAEWSLMAPPKSDAESKDYPCYGSGLEECSLHLHGYTERADPSRDSFSSPSAVGLMLGIGNVGDSLGPKSEGDTFITRDGGISWHAVKKGTYMWEYGDQGSIIVIVEQSTPTKVVYYTLDEGKTWTSYQFSDVEVSVEDISTVPSDTSRNFLLWARTSKDKSLLTINIDFTGLADHLCKLDVNNPDAADSDYYLWEPKHPAQDSNCLFGHVAQYFRKKPESRCYNGADIPRLHKIAKNCSCTRQDFECDYNFERQKGGSCELVPGLQPADHKAICDEDPNTFEYYEPTGYRRIPLTTCQGGKEMDYTSGSHPCPGREEEYQRRRGLSGIGLFFAIVLPFAAAGALGYWAWRNWDGKFGRIRLGEGGPSFDSNSPWIAWPVAAISGLVAVVAALPLLASSLWRSVSVLFGGHGGRTYTSRRSFAQGRGDYAAVDPDEGELLGEDSDDEV